MDSGQQAVSSATYNMQQAEFDWELEGRVTVIDHGAIVASQNNFVNLMQLGALSVITFDPAGRLHGQEQLKAIEEFQIVPHAVLGNGQNATLYACLDPTMSGTLEPLEATRLPGDKRTGARVLTQLAIGTLTLDSIKELNTVDWLSLDARHDSMAILGNGVETLEKTLLIRARIPFAATHRQQTEIADVCQWMTNHGFQCYRIDNTDYQSHFPNDRALEKRQATQLAGADALFVPSFERIDMLPVNRLVKLAFLLDTIHGIHDLTYDLLARVDHDMANAFLVSRGYVTRYYEEKDTFTLTAEYSPAPW